MKLPVPPKKTVNINVIVLQEVGESNPVIDVQSVQNDLRVAEERYAQIGVKLDYGFPIEVKAVPSGVDLSDGLDVLENGNEFTAVSTEAKDLIEAYGTNTTNSDMHIFYIGEYFNISGQNRLNGLGIAIAEFGIEQNDSNYTNNIFITNNKTYFTLAHELGHILTNQAHYGTDYFGTMPASLNLMKRGPSGFNGFSESKRFNSEQDEKIYNNEKFN
jgi:hypothetical protein